MGIDENALWTISNDDFRLNVDDTDLFEISRFQELFILF